VSPPRTGTRFLVAAIRAQLAAGVTPQRLMEDMELTEADFNDLMAKLYAEDRLSRIDKPPEQMFTDYCLRQEGVIKDLDRLIHKWTNGNQPQAVVGAARAKSEIIDRILKTGQELGLIHKAAERHLVIAGVAVSELNDSELRAKIAVQLEAVQSVMSRYGEIPMLEAKPPMRTHEPIQLAPTPAQKAAALSRSKGGMSKASGGHAAATRRVIVRKKPTQPPPDLPDLPLNAETD